MPTYQYRCSECGQELEVVQKFSDASLTVCPNCEGALRKVYNAVGVVFKGSGFYSTDNRAGNGSSSSSESGSGDKVGAAAADSSKSASGKSSSDSSGSSDSKSESSPSPAPAKAAAG